MMSRVRTFARLLNQLFHVNGSQCRRCSCRKFCSDESKSSVVLELNRRSQSEYQRLSPIEHVLRRPDSYIGSVVRQDNREAYMYEDELKRMIKREVNFVPGFLKIFDEILVNAADNKRRDPNMKCIRVDVDRDNNFISVWNDGCGIPIEIHPIENVYIPTLIFGTLFTSSNYDDSEIKVVGGRNGFGAKLCNIFSTEFMVETGSEAHHVRFLQVWKDNMTKVEQPFIEPYDGGDFTCVRYRPDLAKFGLSYLTASMEMLLLKRAVDVAGTLNDVRVFFNGKELEIPGFRSYIDLYLGSQEASTMNSTHVTYADMSDRWQVALATREDNHQQISFVNNIATCKGGQHVEYILDQLVKAIKKTVFANFGIKSIRTEHIKAHVMLFINCLIENPAFDSQAKESLTTLPKNFGSTCALPKSFFDDFFSKSDFIERIIQDVNARQTRFLSQPSKNSLSDLVKLDDAVNAGTKESHLCSLILTEGDSAKALAVAGLGVLGRNYYGIFPVKGKLINTRGLSKNVVCKNDEIAALIRILGLKFDEDYSDERKLMKLRYGRLLLMTDQDPDGSHIKGLIINFIHSYWPSLIHSQYIQYFVTPLIKAFDSSGVTNFYSMKEFEDWKAKKNNFTGFRIKYYKGLGTSTSKEGREYFSQIKQHTINLVSDGEQTNRSIQLAFDKEMSNQRKDWIISGIKELRASTNIEFTNERTYSDFVNRELVEYSWLDLKRSIPCLIDGLKPSQRKVLSTLFKKYERKEVRVSQLAGAVIQHCNYNHGDESLVKTIIRMAQTFVGSNNINLLLPIGQFGTRHMGGNDSASARYIYTALNPITRLIFCQSDDDLLSYGNEENSLEPDWFCPIIPLILVNGSDGIGTGWATKILPHSPFDVIESIQSIIDGRSLKKMAPCFRNFTGTVKHLDENRFLVNGRASVICSNHRNSVMVEVRELPAGTWTQKYKGSVLEKLKCDGSLKSYQDLHDENHVHFILQLHRSKNFRSKNDCEKELNTLLKLSHTLYQSNMVLFGSDGVLRKYNCVEDILHSFAELRKRKYVERIDHKIGSVLSKLEFLQNQIRFIRSKIDGDIVLEGRTLSDIESRLVSMGFQSYTGSDAKLKRPSFDYLLNMPLSSLCEEKVCLLSDKAHRMNDELEAIRLKSWKSMWKDDLDTLHNTLEKDCWMEHSCID